MEIGLRVQSGGLASKFTRIVHIAIQAWNFLHGQIYPFDKISKLDPAKIFPGLAVAAIFQNGRQTVTKEALLVNISGSRNDRIVIFVSKYMFLQALYLMNPQKVVQHQSAILKFKMAANLSLKYILANIFGSRDDRIMILVSRYMLSWILYQIKPLVSVQHMSAILKFKMAAKFPSKSTYLPIYWVLDMIKS